MTTATRRSEGETKQKRAYAKRPEVITIAGVEYVPVSYLKKHGVVTGLGAKSIEKLLEAEGVTATTLGRRKLYNKQKLEAHFKSMTVSSEI